MKLIAETAWHHQGELGFMEELISAIIRKTKADIIKLHLLLDLEEYIFSDHVLFDKYRKWSFSKNQWHDIIKQTRLGGKELMLLFNDTKAVQFGMPFNPAYVEIHSVCLNDINLMDALKEHLTRETKVVLGVGGSSLYEIENAINILQHQNVVLMFGFQNYPTKYADINFAKMRRIMKLFPEFEFGYADHTAWDEPDNILITLFGASLGIDYVEKHITIAYGEERIDWSAAISIDMFNEIREKIDLLEACNGDGLLRFSKGEEDYSIYGPMKKAALLTRGLKAGQTLERDMFTFKRTGQTTDLSQLNTLRNIGKKVICDLRKNQVLLASHIEKGKN